MLTPQMHPEAGHRMVRHAGDVVTFAISPGLAPGGILPKGWEARLRTNLGRASQFREEVVQSHYAKLPLAGASWRDLPMMAVGERWEVRVPLTEVGTFRSKPYLVDPEGRQHWPSGPDVSVHVHPSWTRTGNTIYCAFPRMFGAMSKHRAATRTDHDTASIRSLDEQGYAVIPPSGTLRDFKRELNHVIHTLGCRIIHLLPVGPTPTTFARFGRYGSPYAVQDLTAIDPALVEFDKRTTGVDQFEELTAAIHGMGARLFLDIVINHTGWGSREWNEHPGWFLKKENGEFESPGAWDVVWEDLVEFDQSHVPLWDYLANVFLVWCRRGVDGFRCDAGYKVPVHVWQYITARVRQEYPDTVFLLEGLGGPWDATSALLTDGGMQWAYSELFQNHGSVAVSSYLDHSLRASDAVGVLVHYSETHDNSRLAAHPMGLAWSRHRNRLCALTSVAGGFGFTCGVEWGAAEQVNVHSSRGLNWGAQENLVGELGRLNRLLADHPCFFDGAVLTRVSQEGSVVYAMRRDSADRQDSVLVLINTDVHQEAVLRLASELWAAFCATGHDLLAETEDEPRLGAGAGTKAWVEIRLTAGAVHCIAPQRRPSGLDGDGYRMLRAQADWAMRAWAAGSPIRLGYDAMPDIPKGTWQELGHRVAHDPERFLAATLGVESEDAWAPVIEWTTADERRILVIPPQHWLLIRDDVPFRARLMVQGDDRIRQEEAVRMNEGYVASFAPSNVTGDAVLEMERYGEVDRPRLSGRIRFLASQPVVAFGPGPETFHGPIVLLTNERGGMCRIPVDLGRVTSKYDCVLGANLHRVVPVDRHVLAKRLRVWVNADGFITPLNGDNLIDFDSGPPAHWRFVANAGNGRSVEIHLVADMLPNENTVMLQFSRPDIPARFGRALPPEASVRLTVRLDVEDRSFHCETKHSPEADHFFRSNTRVVPADADVDDGKAKGFEFQPAADRTMSAVIDVGTYHDAGEWSFFLSHSVEATRGMEGSGDAYSPGWFDIPMPFDGVATLQVSSEVGEILPERGSCFVSHRVHRREAAWIRAGMAPSDRFGRQLVTAIQAFVVKRDDGRTVIAGYPWFLDWGRDSLIAARGMLAAGMTSEVRQLVRTFARFEDNGTLPNSIHGEDASNRDTSDAPLWFGIVCEELAAQIGRELAVGLTSGAPLPGLSQVYDESVGGKKDRTLREVLRSIACGYLAGTSNGIRVDPESGLVWSPSHFTWMDTNYPAGTPREGYPIEIQALWIRLLRQLEKLGERPWEGSTRSWSAWAKLAGESVETRFWLEDKGWYSDCLLGGQGVSALNAEASNALRSNCLMAVSLDVVQADRARRTVRAALRHLVTPGALRSLAPLPVHPPHPLYGSHGHLLNDPIHPYWGRYEGDEDTRRKPAYHNGTAWGWTFPSFCEALLKAHPGDPVALNAARAFLGSMDRFLSEGCIGHMPEVVDGDAPHTHRGCDAQAWTVTEALRVWRMVNPRGDGVPPSS